MNLKFLVIEDDELARINIEMFLRGYGEVTFAFDSNQAIDFIENQLFDIVFIDLDLESELAGLKLVRPVALRKFYPVVLSGREDDETIEKAYANGCQDFLSKPFTRASFNIVLKKYRLMRSSRYIENFFNEEFVTNDRDLIDQLKILKEVLVNDRPIYLRGATGTGKTYIAKLIHNLIFGEKSNFIHLNCSEIPENLLESELFGHEKGAFTGAVAKKLGKLEMADGGTLFLDEVATMPKSIQKKLLRVLEEKSFSPLGSEKLVHSNFRLISATCDDLEQMVKAGEFREDLFYRLEGYNIELKDLRKRRQDIPILIRFFMKKSARRVVITSDTMEILKNYSWPGNVRELQKLVDLLISKEGGVITPNLLPEKFLNKGIYSTTKIDDSILEYAKNYGLKAYVEKIENQIVAKVLEEKEGKVREAFTALQISSSSFYRIKERIDHGKE